MKVKLLLLLLLLFDISYKLVQKAAKQSTNCRRLLWLVDLMRKYFKRFTRFLCKFLLST